jgi:hypothetical protein
MKKILKTLVARYLRALSTVINTHVGGQPSEVQGGRENDSEQCVLPPSPHCHFHLLFPSYCDVAQARRYFASSKPKLQAAIHTNYALIVSLIWFVSVLPLLLDSVPAFSLEGNITHVSFNRKTYLFFRDYPTPIKNNVLN